MPGKVKEFVKTGVKQTIGTGKKVFKKGSGTKRQATDVPTMAAKGGRIGRAALGGTKDRPGRHPPAKKKIKQLLKKGLKIASYLNPTTAGIQLGKKFRDKKRKVEHN